MKRFILKTFSILFPLIIIAFVMEILLRNIPNDYLYKKHYLDKHSSEIETLVLGNSHAFYGLNPEFFSSKTYNASHPSESLYYDYEILKKYQSNLKNLKTIVLPISYFSLFYRMEGSIENWRVKFYNIYYDINSSNKLADNSEVLGFKLDINCKRLLSYYVLGDPQISCSKLGYGLGYSSKNAVDLIKTGQVAVNRHTIENINAVEFQFILQENVQILKSIISWAEANNVHVLILTLPAYKTYTDHLNMTQLNTTIKTTQEICDEYSNCSYENFLTSSNFVAADFYNADHLSDVGAKKISIIVNQKILELK